MEQEDEPVELTPAQMEAWLEMLRDMGVESFEGPHFSVRFFPQLPTSAEVADPADKRDYKQEVPKSAWHHPRLWPGGKPPEFPK